MPRGRERRRVEKGSGETWARVLAWLSLFLLLVACSEVVPHPAATETLPPATLTFTPTPTFSPARFGTSQLDVPYCTVDGLPQKLDVYYPAFGGPWPAVVYVHGGSWMEGDKAEGQGWSYLTAHGYLVVSVNYRLATPQIKFPAMIQDVKCAIRFLRAHAAEYNLDPNRIGAVGASAGGHLAALLGVTDETAGWEVGEYLDQSSRVQAVITMAGLSDFTRRMFSGINSSIYYVFGELAGRSTPRMIAASPVTYITPDDPPFLILHGDQDGVVPLDQAETLHARLSEAGVASTLVIVHNGNHGLQGKDASPTPEEISAMILEFLEENLK